MADINTAGAGKNETGGVSKSISDNLFVQVIAIVSWIFLMQYNPVIGIVFGLISYGWLFHGRGEQASDDGNSWDGPAKVNRRNENNMKTGKAAESFVSDELDKQLPIGWVHARNIYVPNKLSGSGRTEIDLLVVGTGKIWVVEVKNVKGRINLQDWSVAKHSGTFSMKDPTRQVHAQKMALEAHLRDLGVDTEVGAAVVFPSHESVLRDGTGFKGIPVFGRIFSLVNHIKRDRGDPLFAQGKVLQLLDPIINRQKKK